MKKATLKILTCIFHSQRIDRRTTCCVPAVCNGTTGHLGRRPRAKVDGVCRLVAAKESKQLHHSAAGRLAEQREKPWPAHYRHHQPHSPTSHTPPEHPPPTSSARFAASDLVLGPGSPSPTTNTRRNNNHVPFIQMNHLISTTHQKKTAWIDGVSGW
jgi:hypothetical protein